VAGKAKTAAMTAQGAEHNGGTLQGQHAGIYRHEKRQGVIRQREDQPAEQAEANGVEEEPKGEHGGGSMCKGVMVAPSTTTAAQVWM
jgi:hypothetical protein